MPTIIDISNAPIWAVLAFIIISLIGLIILLFRAGIVSIDRTDARDLSIINDLRVEVASLKGQLETLERLGKETFERAIIAETDIKYLRKELLALQGENASLKLLLTRTQARVIQLVNVLVGAGITVPPEVSLELQTVAVADIPKPQGAEPLSGDIDKAIDAKPVEEIKSE